MNEQAPSRHLLDTHTFLWMTSEPERLGPNARERIEAPGTRLLLSAASLWEMAIKASLEKLQLPTTVAQFVAEQAEATRIEFLDIRTEHAVRVESLEFHHRDPFDRLLIAQSVFEKIPLLSADRTLDAYPIQRVW